MSPLRFLAALFSTVLCLSVLSLSGTPLLAGDKKETEKAAYRLKGLVEEIFAGKNIPGAESVISPGAYIVSDSSYLHLIDALESQVVTREKSRKVQMLSLRMEDDANSSFVVVKTTDDNRDKPRFHTIVFVKSDANDWQIMHWHVSH